MKTMKFHIPLVALLFLLIVVSNGFSLPMADVYYELTALVGDSYRYDYTIDNDIGGTEAVVGMTIGFEPDPFDVMQIIPLSSTFDTSGISYDAQPGGWTTITSDPLIFATGADIGLAQAGFASAFTAGGGVAAGSELDGFSVTFDYTGASVLGSQRVELTFADGSKTADLYSGTEQWTKPAGVIPEPKSFVLLAVGLIFACVAYVRMRARKLDA